MGNKPSHAGGESRPQRISRVDLKSAFASFAGSNGEERKRKDTTTTTTSRLREDGSSNDRVAEQTGSDADKPIYETTTVSLWLCHWFKVSHASLLQQPPPALPSRPQSQMPLTVPCQVCLSLSGLGLAASILSVSNWKNTRQRNLCDREGGHSHSDRQILCVQSHQQALDGGTRTYGLYISNTCLLP
jgi:hypothetical protein